MATVCARQVAQGRVAGASRTKENVFVAVHAREKEREREGWHGSKMGSYLRDGRGRLVQWKKHASCWRRSCAGVGHWASHGRREERTGLFSTQAVLLGLVFIGLGLA